MAAVAFFLGLLKAGIEIAGAGLNDKHQIDLYSKVWDGVPGLCQLGVQVMAEKDDSEDIKGLAAIFCKTASGDLDYYHYYDLSDMSAHGVNPISDPRVGDFTIKFDPGDIPLALQKPLKGNVILTSPWYVTRSGGDSWPEIAMKDFAEDTILMENCAGDYVDVLVGDEQYTAPSAALGSMIFYGIVVPALGAELNCPG